MDPSLIKVKQEKAEKAAAAKAQQGPSKAFITPMEVEEPLTPFVKRIYELAKEFPKGIPDKILQNDMPSVTTGERAETINKLIEKGVIMLYKQGNELIYKVKDKDAEKEEEPEGIKNADNEEKVVFDIVKEGGNMGIWIRDIRTRSNLSHAQLNKVVKTLEAKKVIKAVKSVAATKKKVYMVYDLEPHRSLTGGAWYSDQDFELEFVTVLNQQLFKYLTDKRKRGQSKDVEMGPRERMKIALSTLEEMWKYISNLGISKVELSKEDISAILDTLIYDGKVEKVTKGDIEYYIAAEQLVHTAGFSQVPCGVCPVIKQCSERGAVNPSSCIYLGNWLASDF